MSSAPLPPCHRSLAVDKAVIFLVNKNGDTADGNPRTPKLLLAVLLLALATGTSDAFFLLFGARLGFVFDSSFHGNLLGAVTENI